VAQTVSEFGGGGGMTHWVRPLIRWMLGISAVPGGRDLKSEGVFGVRAGEHEGRGGGWRGDGGGR
jgi:hypothetical protein